MALGKFKLALKDYEAVSGFDKRLTIVTCAEPSTYVLSFGTVYAIIMYIHICMHVRTYIHTYVHTYIHTYICTYVRMYVCMHVRMYGLGDLTFLSKLLNNQAVVRGIKFIFLLIFIAKLQGTDAQHSSTYRVFSVVVEAHSCIGLILVAN